MSSSAEASLSRYPIAPALIASKRNSSSACTVRMIMPVRGLAVLIRRAASMPESAGIQMSRSTMAGAGPSTNRTVSCPVRASPTTSRSGEPSSRRRTPCRKRSWSSASSTRIFVMLPPQWDAHGHRGALARAALHVQAAPHQGRPLLHRRAAEVVRGGRLRAVGGQVEAGAVVLDAHDAQLLADLGADRDGRGAGVAAYVS